MAVQAGVAAGEAEVVPVRAVLLVADLVAAEALAEVVAAAVVGDEAAQAGEADAAVRMPRLSAIAPGARRIRSEPSCSLRRKIPR